MHPFQRALVLLLIAIVSMAAAPVTHVDHPGLKKLGWQQAAQAATFREMTTFEMIPLLHEMDVHHIELAPGQIVSADHTGWKVGPDMPTEAIDAFLNKLKPLKMDVVSYGLADFGTTEESARKVFEFGKKLKLKTIVTDAPPESLEMLDKLATEYQINVALTCATPAKRYATCDAALAAVKGRSNRIGVSADLAAWKAAGQDPVDCVKKLGDRVVMVHLNDVGGAQTVDAARMMTVLGDQKFKGVCCVQDGTEDPTKRLENFAKTVNAFNVIVTKVAAN